MNIYTASKFENHAEVRLFNSALRAQGHTVTWDWTATEEFTPLGVPYSDNPLSSAQRYQYGMLDYAGVMSCELLIMLDLSDYHLNGGRWEAGMAIGAGKQVWIVNYTHRVIFDVLPQVTVIGTTADALKLLEPALAVA